MGSSHSMLNGHVSRDAVRNKLSKPRTGKHHTGELESYLPSFCKSRDCIRPTTVLEDRDQIREKIFTDVFEFNEKVTPKQTRASSGSPDMTTQWGTPYRRHSVTLATKEPIPNTSVATRRSHSLLTIKRRRSLVTAPPPATATRKPVAADIENIDTEFSRLVATNRIRVQTPSAYSTIGTFKRGSLRIVNGAASPTPSVSKDYGFPKPNELESIQLTASKSTNATRVSTGELLGAAKSFLPASQEFASTNGSLAEPQWPLSVDDFLELKDIDPFCQTCPDALPFPDELTISPSEIPNCLGGNAIWSGEGSKALKSSRAEKVSMGLRAPSCSGSDYGGAGRPSIYEGIDSGYSFSGNLNQWRTPPCTSYASSSVRNETDWRYPSFTEPFSLAGGSHSKCAAGEFAPYKMPENRFEMYSLSKPRPPQRLSSYRGLTTITKVCCGGVTFNTEPSSAKIHRALSLQASQPVNFGS